MDESESGDHEFVDASIKVESEVCEMTRLQSPVLSGCGDAGSGSYAGDASSDGEDDSTTDQPTEHDDVFSTCTYLSLSLNSANDGIGRKLCLVCSDVSSGLHYGVASCEACKAFFKRTVQGSIEYSCPSHGVCEITKRRRKACQACRFQKCLAVGMLKEGVRLDRVRGGRQKYRRSDDGSTTYAVISKSSTSKKPFNTHHAADNLHCHSSVTHDIARLKSSSRPDGGASVDMVADLLAIEPDKVYASPDPCLPDDDFKLMTTLSDLADRELVATIGWAKQVPGFLSLNLTDQMSLLQIAWLDILGFNVAFRSTPYRGLLVFADDFQTSEDGAEQLGVPTQLDVSTRHLSVKMTDIGLTVDEYVLLKAVILLNPDVVGLRSPEHVQRLRDRVHDALLGTVHDEHADLTNTSSIVAEQRRICQLLLLLPMLTRVTLHARDFWRTVRADSRIVLHKLLGEMLEHMTTSSS